MTNIGSKLTPGCEEGDTLSRLYYFCLLFTTNQLICMILYTSQQLVKHVEKGKTKGEMIKQIGIIILATRLESGDRVSLWSIVSQSKYRSAPAFGKTGMNIHRFDVMWRNVRWIHRHDLQDEGTSDEAHWRKRVEDFVTHFNKYCTQLFSPSDIMCDDDSISRWYRQGDHWINLGFPIYVAIDRKPENGEEIHNSACWQSCIMIQLSIVKSAKNE